MYGDRTRKRMMRKEEQLAEKKLLLAIHGAEIFEGNLVRQDRPYCCGKEIDLLEARLKFREIQIRERTFTMIEPYCPLCGTKVRAVFHIFN